MTTRNEIIEAARQMLGVRFRHQGRDEVNGVDCVGFLVKIGETIGYPHIFDVEGYRRVPSANTIRETLRLNCDEIAVKDVGRGDIFLMRLGGIKPRHAAILYNAETDIEAGITPSIIHASHRGVMIEPLSNFPSSWFVAGFRIRGLAG